VNPKLLRDVGLAATLEPQLHIAGTFLIYGSGADGELVADLQGLYPGLRRSLGADEVTYTFRKYGVPYFINAACANSPTDGKAVACPQAEAIIRVVLRDLRVIGGGPLPTKSRTAPILRQPTKISPDFKYFPAGKLLPGTSEQGMGGSTDRIEYGEDLLFPIKDFPAYANSQVFMHWGDCLGQMEDLPEQPEDQYDRYRCKQNPDKQLLRYEGHKENYSYPWRDNFCEQRGDGKPKCPANKGHAGQDIRPNKCPPHPESKARCGIDVFEVVAVTKGKAWWKTGDNINDLRLMYDDSNNKFYYMYLHMSPGSLKAAGMKLGSTVPVERSRVIGKVGNFDHDKAGGTSAHLHFEVRRGDDIGQPLSPYFTLIRAYERLIGAQGTEITD
jgi:hypothetical protein